VPTIASVFLIIFQTFMSGPLVDGKPSHWFGQYPPDFFDVIVIDECHRGGANNESSWRGILEYFAPAVQLGLTATPRRSDNTDTYAYFGDPVFTDSLKEGINDGFLTPFRFKQISTTLDDYIYTPDDTVVEGEVVEGRRYTEAEFNRIIEIERRQRQRVEILFSQINPRQKSLVFCATQEHVLAIRDLINQLKSSGDPNYCQRVTADDGELGNRYLRDFQDNEKTIPRRIGQSGSALRKLIRWLAAAGVAAGSKSKGEEQFPRRPPPERRQGQAACDRLLIGPGLHRAPPACGSRCQQSELLGHTLTH
jgi:type I restriction enzyme R subunit